MPAESWEAPCSRLEAEGVLQGPVLDHFIVSLAAQMHIDGRNAYRSPAWEFASTLKGHPLMAGLSAFEAVDVVDRVFVEAKLDWGILPDRDSFGDRIDQHLDFLGVWDAVERPLALAVDPGEAVPLADRWPLESRRWSAPRDANFRRTVTVCFWYARLLHDEGRFFLACRTLASLLDIGYKTAAKLLKLAVNEGILEIRRQGHQGRATRYTFDYSRVRFRGDESGPRF